MKIYTLTFAEQDDKPEFMQFRHRHNVANWLWRRALKAAQGDRIVIYKTVEALKSWSISTNKEPLRIKNKRFRAQIEVKG